MRYDKLTGQPALDGDFDGGSVGSSLPQGGGNPAPDAPLSGSSPAPPSMVPGFEHVTGNSSGADVAAPSPTVNVTTTSATTETVTFASSGIVFNNTFDPTVSAAYKSCILSAEQQIASNWHSAVTINLDFVASAEGQNGELASNSYFIVKESYASLKSALTSLASAEPQNTYLQQAVAHLPATDPNNGAQFSLPLPYARMLGLSTLTRTPEDTVTLNTSYNWSYGQDVINTVEHEITEGGMGRIGGLGDDNHFWSTMDLFRYNGAGQPDYTDGRDGQTTFFSSDGGATLSTLSFNNEFNAQNIQVNQGDTADFTQQDVFGTGNPGETNTLSQTDIEIMDVLGWAPPVPTTAELIMHDSSGNYSLYGVGLNSLQSPSSLGNLGTQWTFGGIGNFGGDTGDMMLENASTGVFQVYDISNGQISGSTQIAVTGPGWAFAGLGDFSGNPGETDMVTHNGASGAFEVYDIQNNAVTAANQLAVVGPEWSVAGFGDFSTMANETDMVLRNSSNGQFLVFDIRGNHFVSNEVIAQVGPEWSVAGFGDFTGNTDETDMLLRNSNTGAFELYEISHDSVIGAASVATVGLDWAVAGFGDFSSVAGETDMLLRNTASGAFQVYDFAGGRIYNTQSAGLVATNLVVSGAGPNVGPSDMALSTSAGAAVETTSANTNGQSASMDADGDDPQVTLITDSYEIAPPLDSFGQSPPSGIQAGLTQAWYGDADPANSGGWLSQQAFGATGGTPEPVPPMSDFLPASGSLSAPMTEAALPQSPAPGLDMGAQQSVPSLSTFGAGVGMAGVSVAATETNNPVTALAPNLLHSV